MTQVKGNKKETSKNFSDIINLLIRLFNNAVFLFSLFALIIFAIYAVGNYQNFVDKSQLLVLSILAGATGIQTVLCFVNFILRFIKIFFIGFTKKDIIYIFLILFLLIFGAILLVYATVIKKLSLGI